jgi:uncharacterized protein (DUF427 family)
LYAIAGATTVIARVDAGNRRIVLTPLYGARRMLDCPPRSHAMPTATWHETVLARSDDTVVVENNHYFPADALVREHVRPSDHTSHCPWKGTAHYYDVVVGDAVNANAAWYYPEPRQAADEIRGRVAFWKGVQVDG